MNWSETAQAVMAAMVASGVKVDRKVIVPGPNAGRRCKQFTVAWSAVAPQPQAFQQIPKALCAAVPTLAITAVFTKDCHPTPGDDGSQPDADKATAWTLEFLAEAQAVWNSIYDHFADGCDGVIIGNATTTGPSGGVASLSIPLSFIAADS